jgi:hypothetical protein
MWLQRRSGEPPFIIGDGIHSILELVEQENKKLYRGNGHEKPLTKIYLDSVTEEFLHRMDLTILIYRKKTRSFICGRMVI